MTTGDNSSFHIIPRCRRLEGIGQIPAYTILRKLFLVYCIKSAAEINCVIDDTGTLFDGQMQNSRTITSCCVLRLKRIISALGISHLIPCITFVFRSGLFTGSSIVNCQMQCHHRVTSLDIGERIGRFCTLGISGTIPYKGLTCHNRSISRIRKKNGYCLLYQTITPFLAFKATGIDAGLMDCCIAENSIMPYITIACNRLANRSIRQRDSIRVIDSQMQNNCTVATRSIRCLVFIIAGHFTPFSVPEQRVTLCQNLFTSGRLVNGKVQRHDCTVSIGIIQRIRICSGCRVFLAVIENTIATALLVCIITRRMNRQTQREDGINTSCLRIHISIFGINAALGIRNAVPFIRIPCCHYQRGISRSTLRIFFLRSICSHSDFAFSRRIETNIDIPVRIHICLPRINCSRRNSDRTFLRRFIRIENRAYVRIRHIACISDIERTSSLSTRPSDSHVSAFPIGIEQTVVSCCSGCHFKLNTCLNSFRFLDTWRRCP